MEYKQEPSSQSSDKTTAGLSELSSTMEVTMKISDSTKELSTHTNSETQMQEESKSPSPHIASGIRTRYKPEETFECITLDEPELLSNLNNFNPTNYSFIDLRIFAGGTDQTAQEIARIISDSSLKSFVLDRSDISDSGAIYISNALKDSKTIVEFYINGGNLGDVGVQSIAEAIKVNSCIKAVYMFAPYLSETGLQHLLEGIKENTAISRVGVCGYDKFGGKETATFLERLGTRKKSLTLCIASGGIMKDEAEYLQKKYEGQFMKLVVTDEWKKFNLFCLNEIDQMFKIVS
eukprot:TRINITY_DN1950_c0_g1_i1.p1 TRINITY_DN1950_c0_g1~~TRINITY_DN1950_c0_g1_i1.p1  ORF type:complete len:292 (-),score=29.71 TRINITY_DN1950_c0_g1_i1:27-902(-)